MSSTQKFLSSEGLEHLIALIKGADDDLRDELTKAIADAIASAGPSLSADEVTLTISGGKISVKTGGVGTEQLADGSVTADKLADGAITIEQIDTSTVTPDAIGAAPKSHTHAASDVTSGTLPVARGGTGVTTDDALYQKVVSSHFPDNDELLAYLGLS